MKNSILINIKFVETQVVDILFNINVLKIPKMLSIKKKLQ